MAADGGLEAPSVEKQLHDPIAGRSFDFFQAVTLLEALAREAERAVASVGEGGEPSREAVRFASTVRLTFPATEIASIAPPAPEGEASRSAGPATMTVNFLGLAGALGPLPAPFAEQVLRRTVTGDTAARDFLDIFNHRLVSLVYRIKKRHRIALGVRSPVDDDVARYLFALIGLGVPSLRDRIPSVQDRSLLFYAGLLARDTRPVGDLVAILRCHFGVPVEGTPFVGGFYPIEPSHRTTIGPSGRNRRLGDDAVLGARSWDPSACIEIRLGPLGVEDYLRFLPGTGGVAAGDRLAPLLELVRFYTGQVVDARVRLVLRPAAAPGRRKRAVPAPRTQTLGERPRLGYTAWVGRSFEQREVVLGTAALRGAPDAR